MADRYISAARSTSTASDTISPRHLQTRWHALVESKDGRTRVLPARLVSERDGTHAWCRAGPGYPSAHSSRSPGQSARHQVYEVRSKNPHGSPYRDYVHVQ